MDLSSLISINQAVGKLIMGLTDRQERIDFLLWWKENFFYGLNGIKKAKIFQLIVKPFPLRLGPLIILVGIKRLLNSTEHMFSMSQIIIQLNLGHERFDEFMVFLALWIFFDVELLFDLTHGVGLWELYVVEVERFTLFVDLVVEYEFLINGFCVFGSLSLQKFWMFDVVWFGQLSEFFL